MTAADRRSALAALEAARPGMAKLDASRHPDEIAADIIEIWTSIETALRSLMGGSTLSGQPLIRELRSLELISLERAHCLLELQAVRERVDDTAYQPSEADITVAREAYNAVRSALAEPPAGVQASTPTGASPEVATMAGSFAGSPAGASARTPAGASSGALAGVPDPATVYTPLPREDEGLSQGPVLAVALLVLVALLLATGAIYWNMFRRGALPDDMRAAIALYESGQPEAARAAFSRAARAHPELALPHLYLGRIARADGDFSAAGSELKTAVELEPQSPAALDELGAFFLARGTHFANEGRPDLATADYDAARRTYVQALRIDPADSTALGYLGCALERLGRSSEAAGWFERAGRGPWSVCAAAPIAAQLRRGRLRGRSLPRENRAMAS